MWNASFGTIPHICLGTTDNWINYRMLLFVLNSIHVQWNLISVTPSRQNGTQMYGDRFAEKSARGNCGNRFSFIIMRVHINARNVRDHTGSCISNFLWGDNSGKSNTPMGLTVIYVFRKSFENICWYTLPICQSMVVWG